MMHERTLEELLTEAMTRIASTSHRSEDICALVDPECRIRWETMYQVVLSRVEDEVVGTHVHVIQFLDLHEMLYSPPTDAKPNYGLRLKVWQALTGFGDSIDDRIRKVFKISELPDPHTAFEPSEIRVWVSPMSMDGRVAAGGRLICERIERHQQRHEEFEERLIDDFIDKLDLDGVKEDPTDWINHPPHYLRHPSGIECIEVTRHMNFNLGNAVKYIWRAGSKGDVIQDLEKAKWYLEDEIERLKKGSYD